MSLRPQSCLIISAAFSPKCTKCISSGRTTKIVAKGGGGGPPEPHIILSLKNLFCLKLAKIEDVKIDRMCTQCTLYSQSVIIFFLLYLYNVHTKECTFDCLTNLFFRYNKKRAYKYRNTRQTASLT